MGRELVHRNLPLMGNHRRQRKALPRQADRRLQQLGKGQLAKASGQLGPGRRAARDGHRCPAIERHLPVAGGLDRLYAQGGRRMAVAVEAVQLALAPDQREGVTANATTGGFDHRQCGCRGDGGVDGIAALLHDLDARLGSQGLGRGDHAPTGENALALRRIRVLVGRKFQHGGGSSIQEFSGREKS